MRTRALVSTVTVSAAAFAATALIALGTRDPNPADAATRGPKTAAEQLESAKAVLRDAPANDTALANFALASLTLAKQTADSTWYRRADQAASKAIAVNPQNVLALEAAGTLANARHRFADALGPATTALRLAPDRFASLEILTDAQIELGRYEEGFATANKRLALRPDLASYSRASYAAELRGERRLATALMRQAVDASRPGTGDRAWAQVHVGLLELGSGNLDSARAAMAAARMTAPKDATALAGDAHVKAVSGDLAAAAEMYRTALSVQKTAVLASNLAEVERALGHQDEAHEALALATELDARETANGVRLELDQAAVEADFATPDEAVVAKARRGHSARPGVVGDDALGWVLTRSGRCEEGLRYARKSLRLGTQDAMMFFHAGMAAECAGESRAAADYLGRAIQLNPNFSVRWAATAKQALARLTN
jgi:tetratricopeptide (TPR) repeat protein